LSKKSWIEEHGLGDDDLVFRTRNDRRPAPSNWSRALHRACRTVGHLTLRVYDLRHACATTWLRAGEPLSEVARRLGHSVETLVSTYVGALEGDDVAANKLIDATLATTRERIVTTPPNPSHALPTLFPQDRQDRGKRGETGSFAVTRGRRGDQEQCAGQSQDGGAPSAVRPRQDSNLRTRLRRILDGRGASPGHGA
jgi:hypothetical protein